MQNKLNFHEDDYEYDYSQDTIKTEISAILQSTLLFKDVCEEVMLLSATHHPRLKPFIWWLNKSHENKTWFVQNKDNFKLVDDGIEILGDLFCLEDEVSKNLWSEITNDNWNTYFTYDLAMKHALSEWKTLPSDWSKYIDFLPGDSANKLSFLTDVMWLKLAGFRTWNYVAYNNQSVDACYWSSMANLPYAYAMCFDKSNLAAINKKYRTLWFSVRCIKNKNFNQ